VANTAKVGDLVGDTRTARVGRGPYRGEVLVIGGGTDERGVDRFDPDVVSGAS